jgi:hypothetical protein
MTKTKVLVTVKTYPSLSKKYIELVCTAGFREDGSWIRIYPVTYRMLKHYEQRYHKWQWIELDLEKNQKDFRIESFKPIDVDSITPLDKIDPKHCDERRKYVLHNAAWTDLTELIRKAKKESVSLAVFKPKEVLDFIYEPSEREWDKKKLDIIRSNLKMQNLFEEYSFNKSFEIAKRIPYKFSYKFTTEDGCNPTLMIEDWEVGKLYLNCVARGDSERIACEKVRDKFLKKARERDFYFFLGTTLAHHNTARNPFIIIGTFDPPFIKKDSQTSLDLFE